MLYMYMIFGTLNFFLIAVEFILLDKDLWLKIFFEVVFPGLKCIVQRNGLLLT